MRSQVITPRYVDGVKLKQWPTFDFWDDKRQKWERIYEKAHFQQKRYGTDRTELMYRKYNQEEVSTEIDPDKQYTPGQLDEIASAILREDSKKELCRECGQPGDPTGDSESVPEGLEDQKGNQLALKFEEYECPDGHIWYPGEGQLKGIGGDNPILFEEHFQSRKRREIYTAQGTPDPSIVSGMYNRVHPNGRKVNSEEQRKRNGASFYR
jgi:hypothetical protein